MISTDSTESTITITESTITITIMESTIAAFEASKYVSSLQQMDCTPRIVVKTLHRDTINITETQSAHNTIDQHDRTQISTMNFELLLE